MKQSQCSQELQLQPLLGIWHQFWSFPGIKACKGPQGLESYPTKHPDGFLPQSRSIREGSCWEAREILPFLVLHSACGGRESSIFLGPLTHSPFPTLQRFSWHHTEPRQAGAHLHFSLLCPPAALMDPNVVSQMISLQGQHSLAIFVSSP